MKHKTTSKKFFFEQEEYEYEQRQKTEPAPDSIRASGDCICEICGKTYREHPRHDPFIWLHVLCDDTCVKL